ALAMSGFTGHQNGLIGHTTNTFFLPSQPRSRRSRSPTEAGAGSNVHAVSAPPTVRIPSRPRTSREGLLRQSTNACLQCFFTKSRIAGVIAPASAPYPTASLPSVHAIPSAPAIIVESALANFDLNIEPSHAIT